ncbi:MAG: DUF4395 domain-containing protein [Bacillus sp. (in: firmicutes)]
MVIQNTLTVPQPLVRINNIITIAIIVIAWIGELPLLILIPMVYFGLGAFIGKNPIILFGKNFLPKEKQYVMEDKEQLKFNSLLAFIMLVVALVFYYVGLPIVYYIFISMCAAANLGALLGFCIGCFVRFQWKQYQYRRSIR